MTVCPDITGETLILTPFTKTHITEDYLTWLNDKKLMRFSRQRFFLHTQETSAAYLDTFSDSPHHFWAIHTHESPRHIGTLTAYVDIHHSTADLGLMIGHAQSHGMGYGEQAWSLAMKYLFTSENIRKMTGGTNSLNLPMIRIMKKSGMSQEGCQAAQEIIDGTPTDIILFGMLNPSWKNA